MRRGFVAANWKMHGCKADIEELLDQLRKGLEGFDLADVVVCPPALFIAQAELALKGSEIRLGAQNVYPQPSGAFTGEISPDMLGEFACEYVIVGHSERRQLFNEDNETVAAKFCSVQNSGLTPILCVGETLEQRESGETESLVIEQLESVLQLGGIELFSKAVVAYEPIWAIGTGLTASPTQAQKVHKVIRSKIQSLDKATGSNLRILYGGSVKADNAKGLFAEEDIDGALVGGASLIAEDFIAICKSVSE